MKLNVPLAYTACVFDVCVVDIAITKAHPLEGLTRGLAYEINKNRGGLI